MLFNLNLIVLSMSDVFRETGLLDQERKRDLVEINLAFFKTEKI